MTKDSLFDTRPRDHWLEGNFRRSPDIRDTHCIIWNKEILPKCSDQAISSLYMKKRTFTLPTPPVLEIEVRRPLWCTSLWDIMYLSQTARRCETKKGKVEKGGLWTGAIQCYAVNQVVRELVPVGLWAFHGNNKTTQIAYSQHYGRGKNQGGPGHLPPWA